MSTKKRGDVDTAPAGFDRNREQIVGPPASNLGVNFIIPVRGLHVVMDRFNASTDATLLTTIPRHARN
jgi:hypothetical protein